MKLEELEVGKMYMCVLSNKETLVVKEDKITGQESTGEEDEEGKDIMRNITKEVYAGKTCIQRDGAPQFVFSEIHDGQLKEITK